MKSKIATAVIGYSLQKRNYFWYRKTFETMPGFEAVILKINKAQFGSMVLVNGKKAGDHDGCFSSRHYDITPCLKKKGTNVVIVRIGAHPAVLPPSVPAVNDFEKRHTLAVQSDGSKTLCRRKISITAKR